MFWKRSRTEKKVTDTIEDEYIPDHTSLHLQPMGSEFAYHFPETMVESLRQMITRLQRDGKLAGKLSVVAAQRHEGVSSTALALASTLAHDLPKTVCLVDLNWWWPSQPMMDLDSRSPGLAPLIYGEVEWEQAMVRTSLPNLMLLPAGSVADGQKPVIARSRELRSFIDELSQRVDHIIFDIPAILATSDAVPLTSLGEACCLTIQQGVSRRAVVGRALDEICHMDILGVVLNRVEVVTPRYLLKWIPGE